MTTTARLSRLELADRGTKLVDELVDFVDADNEWRSDDDLIRQPANDDPALS